MEIKCFHLRLCLGVEVLRGRPVSPLVAEDILPILPLDFYNAFCGSPIGAPQCTTNCNRPVRSQSAIVSLVLIKRNTTSSSTSHPFLSRPLLGTLLFPNESSDARDHCANERTFLSWLRLSVYMAVVSVAIVISFHLKSQPTSIEKRIALPVGLVFWLLSLACLISGFANYVKTVRKYARRKALVQSGWKTQVVCDFRAYALESCPFRFANSRRSLQS